MAIRFGWRGDLRDRIEVLRRVEAIMKPLPPAFRKALHRYLHGMALYSLYEREYNEPRLVQARSVFNHIYLDRKAGFLREHTLYQRASIAYEQWEYRRAVSLYRRLLREFPETVKREAALIMTARCALLHDRPQMQQIEVGRKIIAQLLKEYPRTRFRRSVIGLRGRIHYLKKRYSDALASISPWEICVRCEWSGRPCRGLSKEE